MIGKRIQEEINKQIQEELASAYIYLSMAAYFESEGWEGMASWMKKQAAEEHAHAMKFFNHLVERGGRVELSAIDKPPVEWESPLAAFKNAYEHEQHITSRINHMFEVAREEKDYPAEILLQWFINEQVEEEDQTLKIVEMLERIKGSMPGMYMLDSKLGKRE